MGASEVSGADAAAIPVLGGAERGVGNTASTGNMAAPGAAEAAAAAQIGHVPP